MKFRNNIKYYIGAAVILFASCKKELQLAPTDQIDQSKAFQSISDIQLGLNGAYGNFKTYSNDMYVNSLLSDEAKIGADNAGQGLITYRFQYGADGTSGGDVIAAWGGYYGLIDQVNRTLAYVDKVPSANAGEEARRPILKGQLLALRAMGHLQLLQSYAKKYDATDVLGIPIMLQSNLLGQPARNKVSDVVAQIQKDFTDAKALLPAVTVSSFSDTVMNQINITAYQARLAAYMGDWANAITYANTVINSTVKPLVTGTAFTGIWTDANTNETLFRIRYAGATDGSLGGLYTTTQGLVYIAPSNKLRASYGATDIRLGAYIGLGTGASGNGVGSGKYFVNKFWSSSKGATILDMKACRISEMYLIRAEAYAKQATPDLTSGAADLNALRAQRIPGYVNQTYTDAPTLIADIATERFKELAFEGFRFFDLKRTGSAVQRLATDVDSPTWQTLAAGSYLFALPIPQSELLANKNMVQNPGGY
ncbi:RagB/SusD family nutrient uptake outer membrane protein [Chitinophagaceae bacterium LWZ2-11]